MREKAWTAGKLMPASLFLLQMPSDTSERLADRKTEPDCQVNGKRLPAIAVNPDHSERVVELVAYGDVYQEVSGSEVETESIPESVFTPGFFSSCSG
ncbi:hypothetical protein QL285_097480 [Trifolium repens]|nr:hypothetical protein QL285_099021 [Trifolium repens]KAK2350262.1 hypothetical protein QL285_098397 [Trifolium repens]KAK2351189.1 hypothetical protein QL285_097480 [Trifolium repens]